MTKPTKQQIRDLMSWLGKRSNAKLTPAEKSARGKHAVDARERKRAAEKAAADSAAV